MLETRNLKGDYADEYRFAFSMLPAPIAIKMRNAHTSQKAYRWPFRQTSQY
jgi:hypothetical protein